MFSSQSFISKYYLQVLSQELTAIVICKYYTFFRSPLSLDHLTINKFSFPKFWTPVFMKKVLNENQSENSSICYLWNHCTIYYYCLIYIYLYIQYYLRTTYHNAKYCWLISFGRVLYLSALNRQKMVLFLVAEFTENEIIYKC